MSDREPVYRNKKYLDDDERFQSSKKEVNFWAPERQSTIQATKVELSNEEANLIADNVVRDLNIPKDRIFADAINIIPLQWSVENMKNQIKEYQKNHQLNPDWKIGKHTYLELSMQAYFDDNRLIEMYNKWMSQSEQENILHFWQRHIDYLMTCLFYNEVIRCEHDVFVRMRSILFLIKQVFYKFLSLYI